jgi:hypothetical protein
MKRRARSLKQGIGREHVRRDLYREREGLREIREM